MRMGARLVAFSGLTRSRPSLRGLRYCRTHGEVSVVIKFATSSRGKGHHELWYTISSSLATK